MGSSYEEGDLWPYTLKHLENIPRNSVPSDKVIVTFTIVLDKTLTTRQVDYTNAFAQADLNEEVYIEPPKGFDHKDKNVMVLHLIKSLNCLKQVPETFLKISAGLLEQSFYQSTIYKYIFMKQYMVCVIYVDDTINADPVSVAIKQLITNLGIAKNE